MTLIETIIVSGPAWVTAFAALGALVLSWLARRAALKAVVKVEEVRHETNSMRAVIERQRVQDGRDQRDQEIAKAKEVVREDAVADAATAAKVRATEDPQ